MVARGDSRRVVRVGEAIRAEIARLIVREAGDPKLAWTTITGVKVSPDLRQAKVYFAAAGSGDDVYGSGPDAESKRRDYGDGSRRFPLSYRFVDAASRGSGPLDTFASSLSVLGHRFTPAREHLFHQ